MKGVLISIRPKWVEKIANGEKTIEVRKTAPKEVPFKCYIYMTQGTLKDLCDYSEYIYQNRMKVIGEFVCDEVERFSVGSLRSDDIEKLACLSYNEMINYFYKPEELDGKTAKQGFAWHISNLKIYDEPKQISDFLKPCPDPYQYCTICKHCVQIIPPDEEEYAFYHGGHYDYCEEHCMNILRNPPKGWCYVEEL